MVKKKPQASDVHAKLSVQAVGKLSLKKTRRAVMDAKGRIHEKDQCNGV